MELPLPLAQVHSYYTGNNLKCGEFFCHTLYYLEGMYCSGGLSPMPLCQTEQSLINL